MKSLLPSFILILLYFIAEEFLGPKIGLIAVIVLGAAEIVYMGVMILCIDVLLEVGRAVNILSVNVLNAVGDVTYPFITGLIVMWGVATALSYVFGISFGWGLAGMWVAFTLDENIRAIIFVRRWNSRKWVGKSFTRVQK